MIEKPTDHPIPPMTDPLGKFWGQPERSEIVVDGTHAMMTERTCARLNRYDHSLPSGVYAGKMWRRMNWLCWYAPQPGGVGNHLVVESREILVVEP